MKNLRTFTEFVNEMHDRQFPDVEQWGLNEATDTKEQLKAFLEKEEKHFAAFLKPKRMKVSITGNRLIVKPASGSFTYTVDYDKKTIDTTGKPSYPESVSYIEIGEALKFRTGFGEIIGESSLNEEMTAEEYAMTAKDWRALEPEKRDMPKVFKELESAYNKVLKGVSWSEGAEVAVFPIEKGYYRMSQDQGLDIIVLKTIKEMLQKDRRFKGKIRYVTNVKSGYLKTMSVILKEI